MIDVIVVSNPFCGYPICRARRARREGPCHRALCKRCGAYVSIHERNEQVALDRSMNVAHACAPHGVWLAAS